MNPTFVIFGSKGLLGQHIKSELEQRFPKSETIEISRSTKTSVLEPVTLSHLSNPTFAFYCQGPTDPKLDSTTHEKFHVSLPKLWLEKLNSSGHLNKFVTFGSVHESKPLSVGNNYLTSKRNWLKYLEEVEENKTLHFQLHTIYGRPVSRHSFVGDMLNAIQKSQDFEMSEGRQLREYHHVKDIAKSVISIVTGGILMREKTLTLSHGKPLSLRSLAEGVFKEIRPKSELKIGALSSHKAEIIESIWNVTPEPFTPLYRDSIKGVTAVILDELRNN